MTRSHFAPCILLLAAACSSGSDDAPAVAPSYLGAPDVIVAPDPFTPLAAEVVVTTDQLTLVEVTLRYADGTVAGVFGDQVLSTHHTVCLLGLHPDENHQVDVRVENAEGLEAFWDQSLSLETAELPVDLPPFEVTVADTSRMEPGYTLFNVLGNDPVLGVSLSHVCLFDETGTLVWYHRAQNNMSALRQLRNGNLLMLFDNFGLREMDWAGRIVNEWWATALTDRPAPDGAIPVPIDTFHHEVYELPESEEADFLVLSSSKHTIRGYPMDVVDQTESETAVVISDVFYAMKRDGTLLERLDLVDLLDVDRLCYDSLGGFWSNIYGEGSRDWTHANALVYDELNDEIFFSLRHQEAVVAIGRSDGELRWILGDHSQWNMPFALYLLDPPTDPSAEFEWPYHQHSPVMTGPDSILMFDNGNNRSVPPEPPQAGAPYSRAVEYSIDRQARTIEQVWAYGGADDPWFSFAVGDADPMPATNNVLVTDGARMDPPPRWARVFEVTREGEIVFEIKVQSEPTPEGFSWLIYRAERIPSFP